MDCLGRLFFKVLGLLLQGDHVTVTSVLYWLDKLWTTCTPPVMTTFNHSIIDFTFLVCGIHLILRIYEANILYDLFTWVNPLLLWVSLYTNKPSILTPSMNTLYRIQKTALYAAMVYWNALPLFSTDDSLRVLAWQRDRCSILCIYTYMWNLKGITKCGILEGYPLTRTRCEIRKSHSF